MRENKLIKKAFLAVPLIFFILATLVLVRFNPDAHHDGILISYGQAITSGLTPYKDFILIWGPLLPYILSIPLYFTDSLINFRLFGLLLILLNSYFLYNINSKFASKKFAYLISITWLLSYPAISTTKNGNLPGVVTEWPNIYGFTLVLFSCTIIATTIKSNKLNIYYQFIAGICLAASILIRVDFIFLVVAVASSYYISLKKLQYIKDIKFFFTGMVTCILSILLILIFNNSLLNWFEQNILILRSNDNLGIRDYSLIGFFRLFVYLIILSILILTISLVPEVKNLKVSLMKKKTEVVIFFIAALVFAVLIYAYQPKYNIWINNISHEISLSYLALSLIAFLVFGVNELKRRGVTLFKNNEYSLYIFASLGSIALMHNLSLSYIWLNSLFIISFSFIYFRKFAPKIATRILFVSLLICSVNIISNGVQLIDSPKYKFKTGSLKNMYGTDIEYSQRIDSNLELINAIPKNVKFVNICFDFINVVGSDGIRSSSKAFTNSFGPDFDKNLTLEKNIWVFKCNLNQKDFNLLYINYYSKGSNFTFIKQKDGTYSVIYQY